MKVLALGSAKSSPGVTTSALALAVTWPEPVPVTVIEADPAGGDLAAWLELPGQPGLVSLAAAGRRVLDPELFDAHLQAVPGSERVTVLCGPVSAEQAHAALSTLRDRLVDAARQRPGVVLVDCGRLDPSSPALRAFEQADARALACRPSVAAVHHLQARVRSLPVTDVSLLAVGDHPYPPDELATATGLPLLGALPFDARAADTLGDGPALSPRALARSSLVRAARALAESLAPRVPADPPAPAPEGDR